MASQTAIGSTKIPLALSFGTAVVADANGTLETAWGASVKYFRMPQAGYIIGFSATMSGTLNTGTLTFSPVINGVVATGTFSNGTINIGTLGNHERTPQGKAAFQFKAGDNVGLMYNKTGTIEPATNVCDALLIVLLDQYDY